MVKFEHRPYDSVTVSLTTEVRRTMKSRTALIDDLWFCAQLADLAAQAGMVAAEDEERLSYVLSWLKNESKRQAEEAGE